VKKGMYGRKKMKLGIMAVNMRVWAVNANHKMEIVKTLNPRQML
jgi:hypothetical protein